MFGAKQFVKVKSYQATDTAGPQIELAFAANKKMLLKLKDDFTDELLKNANVILDQLDTAIFSSTLPKKATYQMGVYLSPTQKKPTFIAEVEIVRKMAFRLMKILDAPKADNSDADHLPSVIIKIKGTASKFKDYFPKNIDHYCYVEINQIDGPDLLDPTTQE